MELLTFKSISLKNTIRKITDPFEFEIVLNSKQEIEEGVIFTVLYTVDVTNENEDQILSETEISPIPKGNVKFNLEADAPDIDRIPLEQLFGLTSIIIIGSFRGQQFLRIGYIVDVYYPGIPNENLITVDETEEVICSEEEEEEDEEEDENDEEVNDLIVDDEEDSKDEEKIGDDINDEKDGEKLLEDEKNIKNINDKEESVTNNKKEEEKNIKVEIDESFEKDKLKKPRPLLEAVQENIQNDSKSKDSSLEQQEEKVHSSSFEQINVELNKTLFKDDIVEFRGYTIDKKNVELNIMVPPCDRTFLISWTDDAEEFKCEDGIDNEDDHVKKNKLNE